MKIGILTYHRSHNYGALLQAYALKHFLMKQGYNDVEFVDYYPDYHQKMYTNIERKKFANLPILKKIKYPLYLLFKFFPLYLAKEKRRKNFVKFIEVYIIDKLLGNTDTYYDLVIYGSDQIWRKQNQKSCPGFNEIYFGNDDIKAEKRIVFSASMGIIDLNSSDVVFLSRSLGNFDAISVREKDLYDITKKLTDKPVEQTIDPVFLLTKGDWDKIIPERIIKDKYILFYNLQENEEAREIAEYISSNLGYRIIELISAVKRAYSPANVRAFDGPENFLSLIKYADYVITSSFHGVAFSIIFEKKFYACLSSNIHRVTSLLSLFGLENRLAKNVKEINLTDSINFKQISALVNDEIIKSVDYLNNSISN